MKKKLIILLYVCLISLAFSQNAGTAFIENPRVSSPNFTFEIHFQPTTWTASPFNGLGDCSWYFDFNNAALNTPTLSYINPGFLATDYNPHTVQIAGASLDKIAVTTDYQNNLGFQLTTGTKYHLYTVQLTIIDPNAESDITWDQTNTAILNVLGTSTTLAYSGDGDLPLPVELAEFTADDGVSGVELYWRTESEVENLGFQLEKRLADAEDWNLVVNYKIDGSLMGQGTVPYPTEYEYVDKLVENGKEYEYRLADIDYEGVVTYHATRFVIVNNFAAKTAPEKFTLHTAYPNPFNPYANIRFEMPEQALVKINIYNQLGQLVRSLQNGMMQPGAHSIRWDAKDNTGQPLGAGVYLYHIEAGTFSKTQKLIYLK